MAGQPSAEPSKSEGFESSGSFYDMSLLGASSQELATTESSMDDLTYPIYTARFDYNATSASELSFKEGDQMHIKGSGDGKTWHASLNGREGNIPKSYVKALEDEE